MKAAKNWIRSQRPILIFAIVVAFTAVLAFVFVVRDTDNDNGGTNNRSDSAVCETLATVPEYDLCREVVRCNERFSQELLGNDCKIRAFKNAIRADVDIVSVTIALDEGEAGSTALEEFAREAVEEFEDEYGPLFGP